MIIKNPTVSTFKSHDRYNHETNGNQYVSLGFLGNDEIFFRNNRYYTFSRRQGRLFPISKNKLGLI